jgi:drug/metabolite transporter (DMT)-like permease
MIPSDTPSPAFPTLALLGATLLWASSFIALKIAFVAYDPMVVIFGRMLVATLCFLVIAKRFARALDNYRPGDLRLILLMGFCEPCLYFIFEAKAVENTTASQAGIITAMLPLLVMLTAPFTLREKVNRQTWAGALLAVSGVVWLTLASSPAENAPNPMLGNFLEFMAMVCATGYTIVLKSLTARYSPIFLTASQAFIGCIFFLPLIFLPNTRPIEGFHSSSALAIVYLGGCVTIGAYGLYNYAVKQTKVSQAASFINLIPVFSVLLGWLILGETFTFFQIVAALLIMAGVFIGNRSPR